jgi:hypothetical protein
VLKNRDPNLFGSGTITKMDRGVQHGKPATKADVTDDGEGMGLVLGDQINATYGFDKGVEATFGTAKDRTGKESRFGLEIRGSEGIIQLATGSLPPADSLDDPSWFPGKGKKEWRGITSAGIGKPEPPSTADSGKGTSGSRMT